MSVQLTSLNEKVDENICNGSWAAIVALARAYEGDKIPKWNGCHDGQVWTPEQLTLMADRLHQAAQLEEIIRDLAANGGVQIS